MAKILHAPISARSSTCDKFLKLSKAFFDAMHSVRRFWLVIPVPYYFKPAMKQELTYEVSLAYMRFKYLSHLATFQYYVGPKKLVFFTLSLLCFVVLHL